MGDTSERAASTGQETGVAAITAQPGTPAAPEPAAAGKRIFVIDGREYPDELPGKTPDEVRRHFAQWHEELHNAETIETKRGEDTVITFRKRVGTKGLSPAGVPGGGEGGDPSPPANGEAFCRALDLAADVELELLAYVDRYTVGDEFDWEQAAGHDDEYGRAYDQYRQLAAGTEGLRHGLGELLEGRAA